MIKSMENMPIGDLTSRRMPFEVSIYQRAYAWETEEVNDFIRDVQGLHRARLNEPPMPKTLFFGGLRM